VSPSEERTPEESCPERGTLHRACAITTADYSRTVQQLQQNTGVATKAEYERLRKFEETRLLSEEARLRLERHTAEHGC
jgi:hypothetical protein